MRVAVTGGSGFIGSHVVDRLRAEGHEVVVIDHRVRPHREDVEFKDVDIVDLSSLLAATQGCEAIFHLAAVSNVNVAFEQPVYTLELNTLATARILEAAKVHGARRVVLASTVWVYSGSPEESVDETTPFHLSGAGHIYTTSKIAAEFVCHDYAKLYKVPFTILRYGIPYGPRMRDELLIPIFIRKALKGEPLTMSGDGSQHRNFVYIDDLARANVLALSPKAENRVYNLEGPRRVTVREVAETIRKILGPQVRIERTPPRPGDYGGKEVSARRIREELGWVPQVEFEEGMRRTIAWYQEKLKRA